MGMDKTHEKIVQADIVVEIIDATEPAEEFIFVEKQKLIRVVNKTDLFSENVLHLHASAETGGPRNAEVEFLYDGMRRRESSLHAKFPAPDLIFISAKNVTGIDKLKRAMVNHVLQGKEIREGTVVTNVRHHEALKQVAAALNDIRAGLENGLPGDLLSLDIRRCLHYLGEITGEVTSEEQLSWIFGKFCIGK
jgi:tRNA modification GTPase